MASYSAVVKAIRHKDPSQVRYKLVNLHRTSTTYDTAGNPNTIVESYRRLYNVARS